MGPRDSLFNVDRDRNQEIWYCSPTKKSKSFAMVDVNGESFRFDAAGNAKAAGLLKADGRKSMFAVAVTGEKSGHTLKVDSISFER